jgi:hypothetical protein
MQRLVARASLVLLVILVSPAASFAAGDGGETMWDWIVRLIMWASGGWHGY